MRSSMHGMEGRSLSLPQHVVGGYYLHHIMQLRHEMLKNLFNSPGTVFTKEVIDQNASTMCI